jgi:phospholipid/cholesterol/gamma-HCH transport system substrate-binding protein
VAAPLVKGRALLRRRLAGVAFLVVVALLIELSIALYTKKFTETVSVALETNRVGNQLSPHADVKVRGVIVGEVRKIRASGEKAVLELALDPKKVALVPKDVHAQLLPKTLFGEKEVVLIVPSDSSGVERIADGDTISQDRSTTALETETALNNLLPLLRALNPQDVATALNALSTALRDRGERFGANLALNAAYLKQLNPALPTLAQDMRGLADLSSTYSDATPDLLRTLDNLAFSGRSLVQERASLEAFLRSTKDFATSAQSLVAANARRFVELARDSVAPLQLYATYAAGYPCLLNRIVFQEIEGERVFGGAQPGLRITVEAIKDRGGSFVAGDEPRNKETRSPMCFGLGAKPIIPFPMYLNPQDGYRDNDPPEDPGKGPPGAAAAGWLGPVVRPPAAVVRRSTLPRDLTPLQALLLVPLMGGDA